MREYQGGYQGVRWTAAMLLIAFLLAIPVPVAAQEDVYQVIATEVDACADVIDLRVFRILREEIGGILSDVYTMHPEFFFWSGRYTYTADSEGFLQTICPDYTMKGEELQAARSYLEAELDRMIADIRPAWSAFEKALYLHDSICMRFSYDENYRIHDVYGFLREGVGVCQAYTGLYTLLLRRVDIRSVCATSASMNHIWNVVFLDGAWYHVDVTWDDPASRITPVRHTWFLKSDIGIAADGQHHDWRAPVICTDGRYDDASVLRLVNSPMVFCAGKWYYIDNRQMSQAICEMNLSALTGVCIYPLDATWYPVGKPENPLSEAYAGLGSYDGMLFFNTADCIWAYDPTDGSVRVLHVPGKRDGLIYGMQIVGSCLTYFLAESPSGAGEACVQHIDLSDVGKRLFRRGDIDGDGRVNARDLTALRWVLGGMEYSYASSAAADVNADGVVDIRDLAALRTLILTP